MHHKVTFLPYEAQSPVYYHTYDSSWGEVALLTTKQGICGFHFLEKPVGYYLQLAEKKLGIAPVHAPSHTQNWWQHIQQASTTLPLVVQGTPFQQQVWQALCAIPAGTTCSYQTLARQLGLPQGARAVGQAVAQNFIAWLIPCHRVVRQDGQIGGYRWGTSRKATLLAEKHADMCCP